MSYTENLSSKLSIMIKYVWGGVLFLNLKTKNELVTRVNLFSLQDLLD